MLYTTLCLRRRSSGLSPIPTKKDRYDRRRPARRCIPTLRKSKENILRSGNYFTSETIQLTRTAAASNSGFGTFRKADRMRSSACACELSSGRIEQSSSSCDRPDRHVWRAFSRSRCCLSWSTRESFFFVVTWRCCMHAVWYWTWHSPRFASLYLSFSDHTTHMRACGKSHFPLECKQHSIKAEWVNWNHQMLI